MKALIYSLYGDNSVLLSWRMRFLKLPIKYTKQGCLSLSLTRKKSSFPRALPKRLRELLKVWFLGRLFNSLSRILPSNKFYPETLFSRKILLSAKCFRCNYISYNKGSFISFEELLILDFDSKIMSTLFS